MIRILLDRAFDNERHYIHAVGLSTDTKPTTGIITGSKFVAVDTGAGYLFDETAGEWDENPQLSEAVAAYLDEHPEALDEAAIEAIFDERLDGIESDIGRLKSAVADLEEGSLSALNAKDKQVPIANGNGSWAWGDILKAPAIWEDASGAIATFTDGAEDMPLRECVVQIEPVQEGSGDPSPENVRPITGWTGVTISHSGADTTDPDEIIITFPAEAGTLYGGTLDLVRGVLTVDKASAAFNGSEIWYWHSSGVAYSAVNGGVITDATIQFNALTLCDKLKKSSWAERGSVDKSCGMFFGASYIFIKNSESITDAETAKTWLANNPITVVYPLATPITYALTPQEIRTLLGTNNIWADTGETAVTYPADTKTFVDGKTFSALGATAGQVPIADGLGSWAWGAQAGGTQTIQVSGTTPVITAVANTRYICGEVATLDITLPASGCIDVVFESGSTATVLTVTPPTGQTMHWPDWFDATSLDANTRYEINIDNTYGVVGMWT